MKYRMLGKTGFKVSEVSLGTWQLGGRWGEEFSEKNAWEILEKAADLGINFIDTADKYNEGLSEKVIGKFIKKMDGDMFVATKCGRRLEPHTASGYNEKNIRKFLEDSLKNMELEAIDLLQLHCPPTEVYYRPEIFELLEKLTEEGKIKHFGVSVEKIEEGLKAIEYPNLATVQIIYNMFRQRPQELFFPRAREKNVGIIVRVPLASGLLTGKFGRDTKFAEGDHRNFNREGKAFDKGETFSGVPYNIGLAAVEELKKAFNSSSLAEYALRWVLMNENISCVIPGASKVSQVETNTKASGTPPLAPGQLEKVRDIYNKYIRKYVHQSW
ncbi:MAG: aldo/keto reductase [Candidatus Humimicrobiaceae bacterium]